MKHFKSTSSTVINRITQSAVIKVFHQSIHLGIFTICFFLMTSSSITAQTEVELRSDGIVVPRIDTSAVSNPSLGQVIYDNTLSSFMYYDGSKWRGISPWNHSGNDLFYDNGKVGIGTANPTQTLHVEGSIALPSSGISNGDTLGVVLMNGETYVHSSGHATNSFFGLEAGRVNTTGGANTGIGNSSMAFISSGNNNTAIGAYSLQFLGTGNSNTAIGQSTLISNTSGDNNSALGHNALGANINGNGNTAIGTSALSLNQETNNTAVGFRALSNNTFGFNNTAVGQLALDLNQNGIDNTAVGRSTLISNTSGSGNTAIGYNSMTALPHVGIGNTALGRNTMRSNISGNDNIAIGDSADVKHSNLSNAIAIGANSTVSASNSMVLGGTGNYAIQVGIGVESPTTTLGLLAPTGARPVGITQNLLGGASSMELTTEDVSGLQTTRMIIRALDQPDVEFYSGAKGAEQITMFIEGTNGNVGIGHTGPSQRLDVDGGGRFRSVGSGAFNSNLNLTLNGTLTTSTSDARMKKQVSTIPNGLDKVAQMRGVYYQWKDPSEPGQRVGVIAQEVEAIVPELVFTNPVDGYKGVRYQEITAVLIEAIKELRSNQQILTKELEQLKKLLAQSNSLESQ